MIFTPLLFGTFARKRVRIEWDAEPKELPASLRQQMDAYWQQEVVRAGKQKFIFDGQLCRLDGWQQAGDRLTLRLGRTGYKHLLFSNKHAELIGREFGDAHLSRALGISIILISGDEKIILIKRSHAVGEHPGRLDVVGGHIHPVEHASAGIPDPFLAMAEEVREEVNAGIAPAGAMTCIGLLEACASRKPELIFRAHSRLSRDDIFRMGRERNATEIADFLSLPLHAAAAAVAENREQYTPSALGALWLHNRTASLQKPED